VVDGENQIVRQRRLTTETLRQTRPIEEEKKAKRCVVLLSGGIDSTVLMYSLVADYEVYPLTINYGQRHYKEVMAARNVCEARGSWLLKRWRYLDLCNLRFILPSALTGEGEVPEGSYDKETMSQTVVPNRNMIFLAIAAGYAEGMKASFVAYAAHTEDHYLYPDTRPEFATTCELAIERGTGGKVRMLYPFIDKSKSDIVALGKKLVVPFKLTWSCYEGGNVHCGVCGTCRERKEAFKKAEVADPTAYIAEQLELDVLYFKEFYNKDRGLAEPVWGDKVAGIQCPTCGSRDMCYSGSPDDPEEILSDNVRCMNCGRITDYYEAHERRLNHPTDKIREVMK